ncbi:MAG: glycosyltransferase, partial [bacterium]|nr:glycosyltransferase [bacterium]
MKALVIIPTYNEKGNIAEIITQIQSVNPVFEVLVIDDNSPDGTGKLLDEIAQ